MAASAEYDPTLIDWFLSLTPEQRLAELESRIAFFEERRSADGKAELPADPRTA